MSATSEITARPSSRFSVLRLLRETEELTDRFAPACVCALLLGFGIWAWFASRGVRLQFDELLELAAAGAPTSRRVVSFLASGVDFNPPLSHFLIRGSLALFGNTELAARLPAFAGVVILLLCIYSWVSRELSRTYGLMAMLVVVCLPVREYAIQARPYGMMLGFAGLAILLYRAAAAKRERKLALVGLCCSTAAVVACHYYAILFIGVLLAAAFARAWELKRLDAALLLCCAGPPLAVLFLLRDVMRQQHQQLAHYFARGRLLSFDHGFDFLAIDPLIICAALILVLGVTGWWQAKGEAPFTPRFYLPALRNDTALALGLLLLPVTGALVSRFVTHAYEPRYFLPAAVGFVVALCYLANLFSQVVPGLVVLLLIPLSLGFGKSVLQEISHPVEALPSIAALNDETTPLLFDTPGGYMKMLHYFPTFQSNTWVIADPAASLRFRGYDTDDRIMLALAGQGGAQTIGLSAAVRRWPQFRLIPRSADHIWVLKCLMDAGAEIKVRQPFGNSSFVFDVSVGPESLNRVDVCTQ